MRRITVFFALVLSSAATAQAEEPAPLPPSAATGDFDAFVKKGDQARIAGQWPLALKAYMAALELREDALVAGRLGLVLMEYHEYDIAAGKLFHAIERGAGANDAEQTRFFQAYLRAKKETCRLDMFVMQNGVKLELDGEDRFKNRREFWTFVTTGRHKLTAALEGFEDQTIEFDAPKGGQVNFTISLTPVKPPAQSTDPADPFLVGSKSEPAKPEDKPAPGVLQDKPTHPANSTKKNGSFVVGIGGGFVFGATPTPAVGPNIFGAWRSRTWWEVGVDARVAWTFVKDERFPSTQFGTWAASVSPCGRLRDRWFGCLQLGFDGVAVGVTSKLAQLPAFGLRLGHEFVLREPLRLQVWGDATVHPGVFEVVRHSESWRGVFLTGTVGTRVVYKF